jgi:predicted enzyme related to lactoylglutathione lyase
MSCPVVQWQIVTRDPARAEAFYRGVFGWTSNSDNPLGYRVVDTGSPDGIGGGIWPSPPEGHDFVQLFIRVSSVSDYITKATALGARVIIPPQTLPDGGQLAILHDPNGIPFGLISAMA